VSLAAVPGDVPDGEESRRVAPYFLKSASCQSSDCETATG
jgi:hypothetical protein